MSYLHWSSTLWPLATFAFVMSITPGPNNMMLLASGARFGLQRTLPHVFGITLGVLVMLVLAQAGVAALLLAHPLAPSLLAVACALYMAWLAWQLLRSDPVPAARVSPGMKSARPLRCMEAALFQFANPKAWAMAVPLVGFDSVTGAPAAARLPLIMVTFALVNLPCILLWTALGAAVRRWLSRPWVGRCFNALMAALMAATGIWMLAPIWR